MGMFCQLAVQSGLRTPGEALFMVDLLRAGMVSGPGGHRLADRREGGGIGARCSDLHLEQVKVQGK